MIVTAIRISSAALICSVFGLGLCSTGIAAQTPSVSQSLESLSKEMGELSTQLANRKAADDERRGEISALQLLSAHTLIQADSVGLLPPHGSGWFKYGFYSLLGVAMADRLHSDRIYAVHPDAALYVAKDLNRYDSVVAAFNERWITRNIPMKVAKANQFAYAFYQRESRFVAAERMDFAERVAERLHPRRIGVDSDALSSDSVDRVYDATEVEFVPFRSCAPWSASDSLDHPITLSFIVSKAGTVEPNSIEAESDNSMLPALEDYLGRCAFAAGRLGGHTVRTRVTMIITSDQD